MTRSVDARRLRVAEVTTAADCEEFIACTPDLDESDGVTRVPLLADDVRTWFRGEHPHVDQLTLLLVRDEHGSALGRCTVHTSAEADAVLRTEIAPGTTGRLLYFGALAAADATVLAVLLDELDRRARAADAVALVGPVSLLPNQTGGTVVGGFEHPGFFDAADNGPRLPALLEAAGFERWHPAATWEVDVADIPAARRRPVSAEELVAAGVRRERVSRLRLRGGRGFVERLRTATNASFAQLPYYTPISRRQMARQTAGLELLMDPRLVVVLSDRSETPSSGDSSRGRDWSPGGVGHRSARRWTDRRTRRSEPAVSFALVLPDPAELLRETGGEFGAAQLLPLLRRRRRMLDAVLIIQGTRPEHQGRGLLSLVARELFAALHAGGYRRLRVTFIGEENPASAAVFSRAGGRRLHQVCFHHRAVAQRPQRKQRKQRQQRQQDLPRREQVSSWCRIAERAPSAHNTQPWDPRLHALAGGGPEEAADTTADRDDGEPFGAVDEGPAPSSPCPGLTLRVAPGTSLPVGDPTGRDLSLGLGAWIESLDVAAGAEGWAVELADVVGAGERLAVTLGWRRRAEAPEASAAAVDEVRTRRVHRGRLASPETLPLPEGFSIVGADRAARLERRAARHVTSSPALVDELLSWLRLDPGDPGWSRDGLSATCLQLPRSVHPLGRLLRGRGGRLLRPLLVQGLGRLSPPLATPGTGTAVVMHADSTRPQALIEAGRRLQRCWLALHRQGLAVSPASEVIDCPATCAELAAELAADPSAGPLPESSAGTGSGMRTPIAWFRVGVPDDVPPRSARRGTA